MEGDGLWKAAVGTFPQPLENASRFPHLPQPLLATRKRDDRDERPREGVKISRSLGGHFFTIAGNTGARAQRWALTLVEFNSLELRLGADALAVPVGAALLSFFLPARGRRVAAAVLATLLVGGIAASCLYYPILVQRGAVPGPSWRYARLFPLTLLIVTLALVLTTFLTNRMRVPRSE